MSARRTAERRTLAKIEPRLISTTGGFRTLKYDSPARLIAARARVRSRRRSAPATQDQTWRSAAGASCEFSAVRLFALRTGDRPTDAAAVEIWDGFAGGQSTRTSRTSVRYRYTKAVRRRMGRAVSRRIDLSPFTLTTTLVYSVESIVLP